MPECLCGKKVTWLGDSLCDVCRKICNDTNGNQIIELRENNSITKEEYIRARDKIIKDIELAKNKFKKRYSIKSNFTENVDIID